MVAEAVPIRGNFSFYLCSRQIFTKLIVLSLVWQWHQFLGDVNASETSLTMPAQNLSLQAEYEAIVIPEQRPYLGQRFVVPGKLEAEHFDEGGPGLAYADTEVENRGNSSLRSADHVDIYDVNGVTQLGSSRAESGLNTLSMLKRMTTTSLRRELPPMLAAVSSTCI